MSCAVVLRRSVAVAVAALALCCHETAGQLQATQHPALSSSSSSSPPQIGLETLLAAVNKMPQSTNLDGVLDSLLNTAIQKGFVAAPLQDPTNPFPSSSPPSTPRAMGVPGTRPGITLGSDGAPVQNPMITMFERYTKPNLSAIPTFFTLIGPLLFARGLFVPETPQYMTPIEPHIGAWRDPFPFTLPSTTPDNLAPPL